MILATFVYEAFLGVFLISIGGGVIVWVTATFARFLRDDRYRENFELFSKASALLYAAAAALLVLAILVTNRLNPTPEMDLPYLFSVWGAPLTITLVLLVASLCLMALQYMIQRGRFGYHEPSLILPGLLAGCSALAGCVSLLFYNLINSFMLTPSLPSGLPVVISPGNVDTLTQLGLMVNRSWIPLTIKLFLVGCVAFSALFSGAAALRRMWSRGGTDAERARLDFLTSYGFKTAALFGASLGIVGYWNAGILHTNEPTLAGGLMGVTVQGISSALVTNMSPLWDVGTAGAMSLGALAGVYYLSRGTGSIAKGSSEQKALRMFLPWLVVLLAIGTYGVLYTGESYPQQMVLALGVFLGGFLMFEALRRYSIGQVRLYVPALLFTVACYALLLYQAPNTDWYNAVAFGGVSWPLIGFPLLAVALYYLTTRWDYMKYIIPVAVAGMVLLIITVKVADVDLVKGATLVALDPSTKAVVQSWAYLNSFDTTFLYQTYPTPQGYDLFIGLVLAFALLVCVFYWLVRAVAPRVSPSPGLRSGIQEVRP